MKIENILVKNNILTYSNEDYDFISLFGGKYKLNKNIKNLYRKLSNFIFQDNRKCGLVPYMKNKELFNLYIDLDFKDIIINDKQELVLCKIIHNAINKFYDIDEYLELFIYKNNNNYHIYSSNLIERKYIIYIINIIIESFSTELMDNVNSKGQKIVDTLNNYQTGIRIDGFNKNINDDTYYSYYKTYRDDQLVKEDISSYEELYNSCYFSTEYGNTTRYNIRSDVDILIKTLKKKKEETYYIEKENINIDNKTIIDDNIEKLALFFNDNKDLKDKFFSIYENYFKMIMSLITYSKDKKYKLNKTIQLINDNFFGLMINIDNYKVNNGLTYRENNISIIKNNFDKNTNKRITFGSIHFIIKNIDETKVKDLVNVLPKLDYESILDLELEKYYKDNNSSDEEKDNFDLYFFDRVLSKLKYPLNVETMKVYFFRYFIYVMRDNLYYLRKKEYIYNKNIKYNYQVNLKLQHYIEDSFKKVVFKAQDDKMSNFRNTLLDADYSKYLDYTFNPINNNSKQYFNLFSGFGYTHIHSDITDEQRKNFNDYLDYIKKYMCSNDEMIFEYFMSFLANIIQEPEFKPHICYIFYSKEKGTGKSSFCKLLKKLIGDVYTFIGNIREVMTEHSTASEYKFLNVIEELEKKMGNANYERLKDKIQAEDININQKFKDIREVKDYCRYIITLNEYNSFKIDQDNRRFVCLSFKKTDNKKILNLLNDVYEVNRDVYTKLFGEYLMNYNIKFNTRDDWIKNRKSDECIKLFYKSNTIDEFFKELYEKQEIESLDEDDYKINDNILTIRCKTLYYIYKNQYDKNYSKTERNFNKDVTQYDFIDKIKKKYYVFSIDLKKLYDYLNENSLINNDKFKNMYQN